MNYAVVLLGLGVLAKYAYENVSDEVFLLLGKPLKVAFLMCLIGAISCGAVVSVLNLAQPVAADSKSSAEGEVEILSKQIATLQVKVESLEKSLQSLQESVALTKESTVTTERSKTAKESIKAVIHSNSKCSKSSSSSTKVSSSSKSSKNNSGSTKVSSNSKRSKHNSDSTRVSRSAKAATVVSAVYLRARASTSSRAIACIPRGASIRVLNTTGGWNKVRYGNLKGYVARRYCNK